MNILVTGGAGFIGSHVADAYLAAGHEVHILDNLSTGRRQNVPDAAIFHEADLNSPDTERIIADVRPEVIAHLAAQSSVKISVDDPVHDLTVNGAGTAFLASAAARYGVRKLIYTSTGGALYGDPQTVPADEDHPILPLAPYGVSKYVGELYVQFWARAAGLAYTLIRPANVYGPRQDPGGEAGVVAIFVGRMLAGEPCIIHGDGEQTKDYVYVADVARAFVLALTNGDGGAFNIATGEGASVNALFENLQRLTGDNTPPEHGPAREGDVRNITLDNTRAREGLGWEPMTDLAEGLRLTSEAFRAASQK